MSYLLKQRMKYQDKPGSVSDEEFRSPGYAVTESAMNVLTSGDSGRRIARARKRQGEGGEYDETP